MGNDAKIGLLFSLGFVIAIAFILYGVNDKAVKSNADLFNTSRDDGALAASNKQPGNSYRPAVATFDNSASEPTINRTAPAVSTPIVVDLPRVAHANDFLEPVPEDYVEPQEVVSHSTSGWPKEHIVARGENLTAVAIKYYGPTQGQRWVNVQKIYQANRQVLSSIDNVREGQKLSIPALDGVISNIAFNTASNITTSAATTRQYTVVAGDSLWRIAQRELGNGARLNEITKLNSSQIRNADDIREGMKLNLPAR